jgi:hemerythrin
MLMEIINGRDEFSVGLAELDNQHKKLLEMLNLLVGHSLTEDIQYQAFFHSKGLS